MSAAQITPNMALIAGKIPQEDYDKLKKKYPNRGQLSRVVRALVQMHLNGKVPKLEFTHTHVDVIV